jgi:acyl carrier protein
MDDIERRLTGCFSAVFPQLSEAEILKASTASLGGWDSVATVTLLAVVEEEFEVTFKPEEMEYLTSFDLILDTLRSNGHGA